jgi:hypothetical protein
MTDLDDFLTANPDVRRAIVIAAAVDPLVKGRVNTFVYAVIAMSMMTVGSILALAIVRPDNTTTGTIILGVTLPIITAFLAKAVQEVHAAVNGRLSELLKSTAKASRAEGQLAEKTAALERVNVTATRVDRRSTP